MTWPLIAFFGSKIPGVPSCDNFAYLWKMYWFKHALVDLKSSPLFAPHIFYPKGFNFAQDEATFTNALGLLPATWAFGEIVSLNLAVLLSFILAGFGMYLFAREITGSRWAAVFAGVAFAFSPYHFARAQQHLNLSTIQWIPFAFFFAERLIKRRTWSSALGLALCYWLTALSSWYYAYYIGMMLAIYVFIRVRQAQDRLEIRQVLRKLLPATVLAVVLILPFVYPSLSLHETGTMNYKLIDVDSYSASVDDFLRPSPWHPVWGAMIRSSMGKEFTDWGEHVLFLGVTVLVLAVFGMKRQARFAQRKALIAIGVIAFILALGTTLHIGGTRIEVPLPAGLQNPFNRDSLPIPLPGWLLFKYLPFFSSSRVWARFGLMVGFAVTLFAAVGVRGLLEGKTGPNRNMIGAGLVSLLMFEFLALPLPMSLAAPRPVDIWLRNLPIHGVVLQLPDFSAGPQMYYTKYHGQNIANGCGAFLDPRFNVNMYRMRNLPDSDSMAALEEMQVDILLLSKSLYGSLWPEIEDKMAAEKRFRLLYADSDISAYLVVRDTE